MPAKSKAMRRVMAIAEHHPEKLHKANRGLLKMSQQRLYEFAATPERALPERKAARKAVRKH